MNDVLLNLIKSKNQYFQEDMSVLLLLIFALESRHKNITYIYPAKNYSSNLHNEIRGDIFLLPFIPLPHFLSLPLLYKFVFFNLKEESKVCVKIGAIDENNSSSYFFMILNKVGSTIFRQEILLILHL